MTKFQSFLKKNYLFIVKNSTLLFFLFITCCHNNTWAQEILFYQHTPAHPQKILLITKTENATLVKEENDDKTLINLPSSISHLDIHQGIIYGIEKNMIVGYAIASGEIVNQIPLPLDVKKPSDLEIGFDGSLFVTDTDATAVYVYKKKWEAAYSNPEIQNTNHLLRIRGALFIASANALKMLNLRNGEISILSKDFSNIKAITEDHEGRIIVFDGDSNKLFRVATDQSIEKLNFDTNGLMDIQFIPGENRLIAFYSGTIKSFDYLDLVKEADYHTNRIMQPVMKGKLAISGSEFLIHKIKNEKQSLEVLEGFYPDKHVRYQSYYPPSTASPELIRCAEKSYQALVKWIENPPVEFNQTIKNGTPPLFWMMTNDYTSIKESIEKKRDSGLWYWKRNPSLNGRVPGYWKWEAVLNEKCECVLPNQKQVIEYLKEFTQKK